jgi:hypothetical protein
MKEHILISEIQENLIIKYFSERAPNKGTEATNFVRKYTNAFRSDYHKCFIGKDISSVLSKVLDKDQVEYLMKKIKQQAYFRNLWYLRLVVIDRESRKDESPLNVRYYTDVEQLRIIQKQVFED